MSNVRIVNYPNDVDLQYGLGSIYLAGPNTSWRTTFIQKITKSMSPVSIIIPTGNDDSEGLAWESTNLALASAIIFWFPKDHKSFQTCVEFGSWIKTERIFYGREDGESMKYLDWLLWKELQLLPAENMDQLVEMVLNWLKE